MELCLDFSKAIEGACHNYSGVMASIDGAQPVAIVITPDGCRIGSIDCQGTLIGQPMIDHMQAWSISILLTGRKTAEPVDEGQWDAEKRKMTFRLRRKTRASIF